MLEVLLGIVACGLGVAVVLLVSLRRRLTDPAPSLLSRIDQLDRTQLRTEQAVREEIAKNREETSLSARHLREELQGSLERFGDSNEKRIAELRGVVDGRLQQIREANEKKLEEMRVTVDEKLQGTLEKRLGESFQQVSERLEAVHKGLGEMQTLAAGVGDLKKVLTNVKTRGTWGEVQLGELLAQILSPQQYESNVATRPRSAERVEFAVRMPGRDDDGSDVVWLPIDAKFPLEDYQRLVDAQERGDPAGVEDASRQLEVRVKHEARSIRDKYLSPPHTTDFGILFVPTEGLYAEVLRRAGLADRLLELRVMVAGPTTLAALLNSLQMGFRTLAIQKRSSEVWKLLGAVKTQFGQFNGLLDKVQTRLQQASTDIESASRKGRHIERRLGRVEELPGGEARALLPDTAEDETGDV